MNAHLQGVAPQYDNVNTSYWPSIAMQGGDGQQEWPRILVKSQLCIPSCRSAAVGTDLNTQRRNKAPIYLVVLQGDRRTCGLQLKIPLTLETQVPPEGSRHLAIPPAEPR